MVAISTGAIQDAEAPLAQAWAVFEELGNWRKWEEVGYSLAQLETLRGRLAGAEAIVRQVGASSRRRESTQARMLVEAQLGCILLWQGRHDEAEVVLAEAAALHAREPYLAERTFIAGQLALLHVRAHRPERARGYLEEFVRLVRSGRPNPVAIEGYGAAAEAALGVYAATGESGALAVARTALTPLRQLTVVGSRVYRARRLLLEGLLAHATGRRRRAARRWRQGLAFATARGLLPDEALLRLAVARHDGTRTIRQQQATRLRQLAATLPAPWLLNHAGDALTSHPGP
jgi:tetratricopeptide (TPR) repeat protein